MAKKKVRTAIIGVGNCASALVQGVQFYQNSTDDQTIPGLMNPVLGGYHIKDIEFSAGVMIDAIRCAKIGLDRGLAGPLEAPSAYFMKSPPVQYTDDIAR